MELSIKVDLLTFWTVVKWIQVFINYSFTLVLRFWVQSLDEVVKFIRSDSAGSKKKRHHLDKYKARINTRKIQSTNINRQPEVTWLKDYVYITLSSCITNENTRHNFTFYSTTVFVNYRQPLGGGECELYILMRM